ncbi:MAG: serine--tRNA ligase [Patescibacteria group bacterium]|nr:MAG: serine--tRNA ligase [Patescibacteria group bacterium]
MIDLSLLRENPQAIQLAALHKGVTIDVDHILEIDQKYRELTISVQTLREERNRLARLAALSEEKERKKAIEEGRKLKILLEQKEHALSAVKDELQRMLLSIPNPAKPDVKVGKDDSENEVIRKFKEPTKLSFNPRDHVELGEILDIIDIERAAKVAGARFAYLKNDGVLLELALVKYAFDFLIKEGFTPVITPVLIKKEVMRGLGYMEHGGEEDMFYIPTDDLILVGTAEHALVPMHMNEVLNSKELPKRYVGFSSAFRREAGSYGKDTRGILRVHQFDKVEMVSFVEQNKDDDEHEYLLGLEEKLFQSLEIPYQVVKMCTGDLGFPAARKFDLEAWIPSQGKYREVTSVSTVTDFQSRRLNIRYRSADQTLFAYVLNGTAFAIGRTIIAVLENYQQEDGSVVIPEVLRNYIGKDILKPRV